MCVIGENSGELIHIEFPITIGTVPFRIPSSPMPQLEYGRYDFKSCLLKSSAANNCITLLTYISKEANSVDPVQIGAV